MTTFCPIEQSSVIGLVASDNATAWIIELNILLLKLLDDPYEEFTGAGIRKDMPLPTKNPNESIQEFIDRCMSDEKMLTEYTDEGQRYAVCVAVDGPTYP